jgi:hypothetical protein
MHGINCLVPPVRLRLSVKSASQPAVFFSHKKPASSTFSQPYQLKRTGKNSLDYVHHYIIIIFYYPEIVK